MPLDGSGSARPEEERSPYEVVADRVLEDPEVSAWLDQAEEQADRDADAWQAPTTVSFRWTKGAVGVVKQAARRAGVPYQTYVKMAAWEAARADLGRAGTPR